MSLLPWLPLGLLLLATPTFAESRPACAARVALVNFRPLQGDAPERRVVGYLYEMHNLSGEALVVQPSFASPVGTNAPVFGTPVLLRPKASANAALPAEVTLIAGQYGLDIAAISRATSASCTLR